MDRVTWSSFYDILRLFHWSTWRLLPYDSNIIGFSTPTNQHNNFNIYMFLPDEYLHDYGFSLERRRNEWMNTGSDRQIKTGVLHGQFWMKWRKFKGGSLSENKRTRCRRFVGTRFIIRSDGHCAVVLTQYGTISCPSLLR